MADFEEAIHQGFSRADFAQEMKENEKLELIMKYKSSVLLLMFESYARTNPICSEEMELIKTELLMRLATYDAIHETKEENK